MAQLATQGHVGKQTLSVEQLLAQFLNANKLCIEKSQKVGWHAENEKWLTAVESTRRVDTSFNVAEHFQKFTDADIAEGQKTMDAAIKASGRTGMGKGMGAPATYTAQYGSFQRASNAGKGKYKSGYKGYQYEAGAYKGYGKYKTGKGKTGKYSKSAWGKTKSKDEARTKGQAKNKSKSETHS